MRILSLLAHPRESSFCHAISGRARKTLSDAGHEVIHHDLYAEGFDPCLKAEEAYTVGDTFEAALSRAEDPIVRRHRADIAGAEGLLVVHPNWWGKPPAILSGWMDRVLVPGVAYRLRTADGLPEGLLAVRAALILNTSDTPAQREENELGDPLEAIWGRCVLPYCGVKAYRRHIFRPVVGSSDDERARWLAEAESFGRAAFGADR
jgi:putative NADPH-quinone reductase